MKFDGGLIQSEKCTASQLLAAGSHAYPSSHSASPAYLKAECQGPRLGPTSSSSQRCNLKVSADPSWLCAAQQSNAAFWSVHKRDTDACQRDLDKLAKQKAVGHLIGDKCEYLGDIRINKARIIRAIVTKSFPGHGYYFGQFFLSRTS